MNRTGAHVRIPSCPPPTAAASPQHVSARVLALLPGTQPAPQVAGTSATNPSNIQNRSYFQRRCGGYEGYTTISRIHFKTTAIRRVKLSTTLRRLLLISLTRCHIKSVHPHTAIRGCRTALPESSVSSENPDDTFLTAQQSLGLQVNFRETGTGSYFDGFPPFRQFYHFHKH